MAGGYIMAFVTASTAKTQSDAVVLDGFPAAGSLTETLINNAINAESNKTGTKRPVYTLSVALDADLNGRVSPIDIIQSDASRILLTDLIVQLQIDGYTVDYTPMKTRDGKSDKVKLQLKWG